MDKAVLVGRRVWASAGWAVVWELSNGGGRRPLLVQVCHCLWHHLVGDGLPDVCFRAATQTTRNEFLLVIHAVPSGLRLDEVYHPS
jgi:hypothetical protein